MIHCTTSANPEYGTFQQALEYSGLPADAHAKDRLFIFWKPRVTERNTYRLFTFLCTGWLGRMVPMANRTAIGVASRQPLWGDPVTVTRYRFAIHQCWQDLIHDEYEATHDEAWISLLIGLQETYPSRPHAKDFADVVRRHPAYLAKSPQLALFQLETDK